MQNPLNQSDPEAPPTLFVELGYQSQPIIPFDVFSQNLARVLPESKVVSDPAETSLLLIHHNNHTATLDDGSKVPAQTAIMRAQHNDDAARQRALAQTWTWPGAADAVARAHHQLAVCEFMSRHIDYKTRARLFHAILETLVRTLPPLTLYAEYAQCFINPAAIPEAPFFNVRLFRVEGMNPGDTLMDTRGLSAFNLPDLQIKFNGLSVQQVANHLFNCAHYVYAHGDRIKTGDTLPGLNPSQTWTCKRQRALVEPVREVIDLDPGKPYAIVPTQA